MSKPKRAKTRAEIARELTARVRADALKGEDAVIYIHPDNLDARIAAGYSPRKDAAFPRAARVRAAAGTRAASVTADAPRTRAATVACKPKDRP